jgi:hypothetical protein
MRLQLSLQVLQVRFCELGLKVRSAALSFAGPLIQGNHRRRQDDGKAGAGYIVDHDGEENAFYGLPLDSQLVSFGVPHGGAECLVVRVPVGVVGHPSHGYVRQREQHPGRRVKDEPAQPVPPTHGIADRQSVNKRR